MTGRVAFDQFREATAVFAADYGIVGHPELKPRAPWEEPNEDGVYSLTQIPRGMKEPEFLSRIQEAGELVVTCMDKDVAHSTWEKLKRGQDAGLIMLTWGGGVVQYGRERVSALIAIARYFAGLKQAGLLPNLRRVNADDHDHVCGAVKAWIGEPLPRLLSRLTGRRITPYCTEEDRVMEALIRDGAFVWVQEFDGTDAKVVSHLHATNRENKSESSLVSIDLDPAGEQMNVAMLKYMAALAKRFA